MRMTSSDLTDPSFSSYRTLHYHVGSSPKGKPSEPPHIQNVGE